ncbi:hypothetical protein [Lactiplantibacillus plantarum]|uniref:hypothetical protein n=1 Tax=Lactiplantibacillus plantarum TaxID=1590 RepID=UPI0006AD692C|nr:hypothetical protein [Lactiplantibacillus plantarum]ALC09306.1 hypothetical protein JM48_2100 [Lactiplantibacillus plantarum]
MAIQLVTDQLSTELDEMFRNQIIGNFKTIEKALNDLDTFQTTLNFEQNKINQSLKDIDHGLESIKVDNKNRDANIEAIVKILSDYDVPVQIVNGKVLETEEGE